MTGNRSRAKRLEVFPWNKREGYRHDRRKYLSHSANSLRMIGKYRKSAQQMVRLTPGWTVKDHLKAAAHHSKQARTLLARYYKANAHLPWHQTSDLKARGAWRLTWRHREAARSHRLAAAYLAGKRIASNTKYFKRYR